jgi:ABC-2 type transport system permease protein
MLRDRRNLVVGLLLPLVLIVLFGYGLSFDVKNVRLTVVMEDNSPTARNAVAGLQGSPYISPVWVSTMKEADQRIIAGESDAILRVPENFSRGMVNGSGKVQLLLNGVDSSTASTIEGYVNGAVTIPLQQQSDRARKQAQRRGKRRHRAAHVVQRAWRKHMVPCSWPDRSGHDLNRRLFDINAGRP